MSTLAEARTALLTALSAISAQRLDPATTPAQLAALDAARDVLEPQLDAVQLATLDNAAGAVADAANGLSAVLGDARLDPLSQLTGRLGVLQQQLDSGAGDLFEATKLGRATDLPASLPDRGARPPPDPPPLPSGAFATLRDEFARLFATCVISDGRQGDVKRDLDTLFVARDRYTAMAAETPRMPWYLVGILQGMEASYRLSRHLHNGDPLTARTVNDPAGRPPTGTPPFSWEESARDALRFDGLTREQDFSVPHLLFMFERFNGLGYRSRGIPNPYLWGGSTHYVQGKFVRDHVFSATAVSDQIGAGVLLKQLEQRGLLTA